VGGKGWWRAGSEVREAVERGSQGQTMGKCSARTRIEHHWVYNTNSDIRQLSIALHSSSNIAVMIDLTSEPQLRCVKKRYQPVAASSSTSGRAQDSRRTGYPWIDGIVSGGIELPAA
jgi:hypothetical protein